jgi:signal transduction histidine kinase
MPVRETPGVDDGRRAEQLEFFELGPADAERLRECRTVFDARVDDVVEQFYAHLLRFPPLADLLHAEPGRIENLKRMQRAYFLSLTDGRLDADYFESRLKVGNAHQRIGLDPVWYIGAFSRFLRLAVHAIVDATGEGRALLPAIDALVKSVFLDMSLAMRTYIYGGFVTREIATDLERAAHAAEETLRVRAETERLKDDLASMIVHDLKNPVNGISMMVQLALRKSADLPEPHRGYLRHIEETCREMLRLIQNLLELSKIEEGKMPIVREPVVLAELVDDVVGEYGPVAAQGGRVVHVRVGTDLAPALADRALLRRVLVNLLVNALRHSGSSDVDVRGVADAAASEVTLSVVDHGRGIPPEQQERVFDKFTTVRRSPADDPSTDTGLGLPFCKLAVESMGGRIRLHSTAAETSFSVTLAARRS